MFPRQWQPRKYLLVTRGIHWLPPCFPSFRHIIIHTTHSILLGLSCWQNPNGYRPPSCSSPAVTGTNPHYCWIPQLTWREYAPWYCSITNLLTHYMSSATPSHVAAEEYMLRYLKGTSTIGIRFSSRESSQTSAFVHFHIPLFTILPLTDAN